MRMGVQGIRRLRRAVLEIENHHHETICVNSGALAPRADALDFQLTLSVKGRNPSLIPETRLRHSPGLYIRRALAPVLIRSAWGD